MDSLGQKYLDSREVAEMVGKEHNKLLRDIRVYITQLNASKVGHTDFFTEALLSCHKERLRVYSTQTDWGKRYRVYSKVHKQVSRNGRYN